MTGIPDPADRALALLRALPADLAPVLAGARRRVSAARERRTRRRRAAAAASILLLAGIAVGAALDPIREWLGITVVSAKRAPGGGYEEIVVDLPEGDRAFLVPLDESPTAFEPAIDESAPVTDLPREGGGSLGLRVLRRGRRWFDEYFAGIDDDGQPEPGRRIRLRRVRLVSRAVREAAGRLEVVQTFAGGHVVTLTLLPSPGDPRRFGDGETLVEVAGR